MPRKKTTDKKVVKDEPEMAEDVYEPKSGNGMMKGMVIGLVGAVIAVLVVAGIVWAVMTILNRHKVPANSDPNTSNLRITVITSKACGEDCFDINLLLDAIDKNGVNEVGRETLNLGDSRADKLVEKYNITKVPTVLVSGELDKNQTLKGMWDALGDIVDSVFVFRQVIPPYVDTTTGELKGLASVIYLKDDSCQDCYDVTLHKNALLNLGMDPKDQKTVDISSDEGQKLLKDYDITKVPTIILRGQLEEYPGLSQIWKTNGKIADDGAYIFTNLEVMGNYMDLDSGELVKVKLPTQ